MNKDRELLELAAKAAGIVDGVYVEHRWAGGGTYVTGIQTPTGDDCWNPLTDDGDAFRLSSALSLTVEFGNNMVTHPSEVMGEGADPLAATRRAIVRAAAEIGKAKP